MSITLTQAYLILSAPHEFSAYAVQRAHEIIDNNMN